MAAEVRSTSRGHYVVDLACRIEQAWVDDRAGAQLAAGHHNETVHPPPATGGPLMRFSVPAGSAPVFTDEQGAPLDIPLQVPLTRVICNTEHRPGHSA